MQPDTTAVLVISVLPFRFATRSRKAAQAYAASHRVHFVSLAAAGRAGRWDVPGHQTVDGVDVEQVRVAPIATAPTRRAMLRNLVRAYVPAVARLTAVTWRSRASTVYVADPTLALLGVLHTVRNRSAFVLDIPERPGLVHAPGSLAAAVSRLQPLYLRLVSRFVDLATVVVPGDLEPVRRFGFGSVELVRNVPFAQWRAPYTDPPAREPGSLRAVVAGSIFEGRGYEMLVDAVAESRRRGSDVRLTVCGPSREDYLRGLQSRARAVGVDEYIEWIPPVPSEAVSQLYLDADVGLVLYESNDPGNDGLSNKIMESVTSGRPVLAGALPENVRFVGQYGCGWNVDMDVDALADALVDVARTPDLVTLSRHCRSLGDDELRWDVEFGTVLEATASGDVDVPGALAGAPTGAAGHASGRTGA